MTENLSYDQIAEFKQTFNYYDEDGGGSLSLNELISKMKPLGSDESKSKLGDMMQMMQNVNSEKITFPEFIYMMGSTIKDDDIEKELELAFVEIVKKGRDVPIEKNTLRRTFTNLGEKVTDEELNRVLEAFDVDPESPEQLHFDEFVACMRK